MLTFRQQLRDTSFRQRNEDVKNLVADERRGKNMKNENTCFEYVSFVRFLRWILIFGCAFCDDFCRDMVFARWFCAHDSLVASCLLGY